MEYRMHEILRNGAEETSVEHIEKVVKWYKRGAIDQEELIYNIAQARNILEFDELAEMFIRILEDYTMRERKEVRHKLLEIIIRRK